MPKKSRPRRPMVTNSEDPYYIPEEIIPKGKSYQWNVVSFFGVPNLQAIQGWERGGWKPVPPKRHPELTSDGKRIINGGQVLMERPLKATIAAQRAEYDKAAALVKEQRERLGLELSFTRIGELPTGPESNKPAPFDAPTAPFTSTIVDLTIKVKLTEKETEAAYWCGMTVERYAFAKSQLLLQGRFDQTQVAALFPADESFCFAGLSIHPVFSEKPAETGW